jgi:hypothetical protein
MVMNLLSQRLFSTMTSLENAAIKLRLLAKVLIVGG